MIIMAKKQAKKKEITKSVRPPVVVVMGHIDHGKTKILDYIRKTKVAEKESGGITQHIGAYEIEVRPKDEPKSRESEANRGIPRQTPRDDFTDTRKITFIDTPGHEAFSKMRSRGAKAADIAILVVASDEGVKPQTKEAITIIKEAKIPFVVALNKIDKPETEPERVKKELADNEVLVEGWGGQTPVVMVSAKTGQGIDQLLEIILLLADLENLVLDAEKEAEGVFIESHMEPKRGVTATMLLLNGKLERGNYLLIGGSVESIKILENFKREPIQSAIASTPVVVAGLSKMPVVGDEFKTFRNKAEAQDFAAKISKEKTSITEEKNEEESGEEKINPPTFSHDVKTHDLYAQNPSTEARSENIQQGVGINFNVILKTDVAGSKEAIEEVLKKMSYPGIATRILKSDVGDINESDVKLALGSKNVTVIGFKVALAPAAEELAKNNIIRIVQGDIIYDVLEKIKQHMEDMLPSEIKKVSLGKAMILAIFKRERNKQIVGGRVEEGNLKKGALIEIKRHGDVAGKGKILQLEQQKVKTESVKSGNEFGMMAESDIQIQEKDEIAAYEEEKVRRRL